MSTIVSSTSSSSEIYSAPPAKKKGRWTHRHHVADLCTVCGKAATGTHYRSVTCGGCRSFFRRSIAYNKTYNCIEVGYNPQECFTLFFCKKCRFVLCIAAGMDPEAIRMGEEGDDFQLLRNPSPAEHKNSKIIQDLFAIEDAHHKLRISKYAPKFVPGLTIDEFVSGHTKLGMDFGQMHAQPYEPASIRIIPVEVIVSHRVRLDFTNFDYSSMKFWIFQAQLDRCEYALLKMIIVCNPMLEGLCPYDVTLLQHEKERCTKTLLSYILARRGISEGPGFFAQIMSIVDVAIRLTSWQKSQHILIVALGLYKYRIPFTEDLFQSH